MKFILFALVLIGTTVAHAGETLVYGSPSKHFYAGGAVGTTTSGGGLDNSSGTWNVFAGYQFNPYLATEISYGSLYDASFREQGIKANVEVKGWRGSVTLQAPINASWTAYVRGGYQFIDIDVSADIGRYKISANDSDDSIFGGVGLVYGWDGYFARLEATTGDDTFDNMMYTVALGITF